MKETLGKSRGKRRREGGLLFTNALLFSFSVCCFVCVLAAAAAAAASSSSSSRRHGNSGESLKELLMNLEEGEGAIDLRSAALVVWNDLTLQEETVVEMVGEEISKRTPVQWPVLSISNWNDEIVASSSALSNLPLVVLMTLQQWERVGAPTGSCIDSVCDNTTTSTHQGYEGYRVCVQQESSSSSSSSSSWSSRGNATVIVLANDDRGYLFGAGRLLREMRMGSYQSYSSLLPTVVQSLQSNLSDCTSPTQGMRGHYIGYNEITDCHDGWSVTQMEQYVRDLAVFGTNQIELLAPDGSQSPHFTLQPPQMLIWMSALLDRYGLNVSLQVNQASQINFTEAFQGMPRLDSLFVASGDPGLLSPDELLIFTKALATEMWIHHPNATVWVSSQTYNETWQQLFYQIVPPAANTWLTGVVYGPHTRFNLSSFHDSLPPSVPIRQYPDICHEISAQYPAPNWDRAFGLTEAREAIAVRVTQQREIAISSIPFTIGFGAYSEGIVDDVHKVIWSLSTWNPTMSLEEMLEQYSRYFFDPTLESSMTDALLGLEANWFGPLLDNPSVQATFDLFQFISNQQAPNSGASLLKNWRYLGFLYRATYDQLLQQKLQFETMLETKGRQILSSYHSLGLEEAISEAQQVLMASGNPLLLPATLQSLRSQMFVLGYQLYSLINLELSVSAPFLSKPNSDRGNNLDYIDNPLNDAPWLLQQLSLLITNQTNYYYNETEMEIALEKVLNRTDPGEGGFYDDLGNLLLQPHLLPGEGYETDPSFYHSSLSSVWEPFNFTTIPALPSAWYDFAQSYFDSPLQLRYEGLDSNVSYIIRVVYFTGGSASSFQVRLEVDEGIQVHDYITKPFPMTTLSFPVPLQATQDGTAIFSWYAVPGGGGDGQGVQVAEVFLIPSSSSTTFSNKLKGERSLKP
jgi:hypothetical protein